MNLTQIRNIDVLDPPTRIRCDEWVYVQPIVWMEELRRLPPHVVAFSRGDHLPDGSVLQVPIKPRTLRLSYVEIQRAIYRARNT